MDSPAPKRRRTSPRIAATATNNNTDGRDTDATTPSTHTPRRKRPEYASPTKASLSRHNPQILARRKPPTPRGGGGTRDDDADEQPASRPGSRGSEESLSQLLTTQVESQVSAPSREPGSQSQRSRSSPNKPKPVARPLPPPEPEAEAEELVDPFRRRGLRRSPLIPVPVEEEPELPPTPSQLGIEDPVVTTPPAGIHSSSPSRKRMKRKLQTEKKSSPLKKPLIRPEAPEHQHGKRDNNNNNNNNNNTSKKDDPLANPQAVRSKLPIHPARRVEPEHVYGEKLAQLEELRKEEEALAEDLKNIKKWNSALWAKVISEERDELAEDFLDDERASWVHGHLLEDHEKRPPAPDPSANILQAAQNPSMWLPFGSVQKRQPQAVQEAEEELAAPISHRPLRMTAEEERPYLQAFSPLTFSSTPPMRMDKSQQEDYYFREITVRATSMPTLFAASIVIIVDDQDHIIEELRVSRLDQNAETELRPFINSIITAKNRAMDRNVSIVTWAMSEWYRTALSRSRFWHALDAKTRSADALVESARELQSRSSEGRAVEKPAGEKDLLPYMGCISRTIPLDHWGDEASVRIEWKISFDWTGEAQSKIGLSFSGPGEWHEADERGGLGGTSKVFDELVRGTGNVTDAATRVLALFTRDD